MLASRLPKQKPKLSLAISTTPSIAPMSTSSTQRPALSLRSPLTLTPLRSPASPLTPCSPTPTSPTARNTRLNQRGQSFAYSTMSPQSYSYSYQNSCSSRSILKKSPSSSTSSSASSSRSNSISSVSSRGSGQRSMSSSRSAGKRQLSFKESPVVYTVTPIEEPDYYGSSARMSRDERRWGSRR